MGSKGMGNTSRDRGSRGRDSMGRGDSTSMAKGRGSTGSTSRGRGRGHALDHPGHNSTSRAAGRRVLDVQGRSSRGSRHPCR